MTKERIASGTSSPGHQSSLSDTPRGSTRHDSVRSVKSIGSADSSGTTKSTSLPPIKSFRTLSKLALSAEASKPKDRRTSHPFPVTAWKTPQEEKEAAAANVWKRLKSSKSQPNFQRSDSAKSGSGNGWGLTMILARAKSKLALTGERALKKRVSLRDFLKVAAMKRSDTDKRRMIRELKRKALLQKKTLLAKFRLAVKLTIFCARNFKQHCLSLANVKPRRNNGDEEDEISESSVDELDEYIGLRTPQSANGKQDQIQQEVHVDSLGDDLDAFDDVDSGQNDLSRERTDSIDLEHEINDDHVDKTETQRINEQQDELAPFIRRLHFHEDDNPDLLIDLSKFKANRQLRIPDETKRILSKEVGERTEHEIYSVTVALRNIKSYGEYPNRMQKKIAEVGLYEKYESKRVIVRQNHPATAFYFILSGAVVVMVMDEETKFARPVAHLYKGQTFGELAIINSSKRNSTVIAKETCEFLSISVQDYHKIFMAGGVKNISDPDQEIFLKSLKCLASWPIHILPQHPNKCQFLFFKNADVIIRDSSISEWIIIVKSGSVQVLKKLRKVDAFGWKKKKQEPVTLADKREVILKQTVFRKILPELQIPLNPDLEDEPVNITSNGRPLPFKHPNDRDDTESVSSSQPSSSRVPNLWPFSVDLSQMESGRYLEDEYRPGMHRKPTETDLKSQSRKLKRSLSDRLAMKPRNRSDSIINEEEKELGGFQPHIRTIQEDLDPSAKHKDHDVDESVNLNPEFVLVHTLTKGQVFGLSDLIIGDQPSFSVVSKGADCILINKQFYMEHASDKLRNEMRQELCPYPTEEELQQGLQDSVDWHAYRKTMLLKSLSTVGSRRHMRATIRGTKVQEAY